MVDAKVIESLTCFNVMSFCRFKGVTRNISVQNASEWNTTYFLTTSTGRQIRFPRNRIKVNGIKFYALGQGGGLPKGNLSVHVHGNKTP